LVVNIIDEAAGDSPPQRKNEDLGQLWSDLYRLNLQNESAKNPFTTWVYVLRTDLQREPERLLAKIDTQSSKNWARKEIIERLELQCQIQELEPDDPYGFQGATGEAFRADGRIMLKWYETVVSKTRETQFLINSAPTAPFDLILGWEWIKAEGGSAFADPVLAMREMALTEGWCTPHAGILQGLTVTDQNRQVQANLMERTRLDADLAPVRRAQGFSKREARRLGKVAENASRAGSTSQTPVTASMLTTRRPSISNTMPGAPNEAQSIATAGSSSGAASALRQ
jgi:hypothetical protein